VGQASCLSIAPKKLREISARLFAGHGRLEACSTNQRRSDLGVRAKASAMTPAIKPGPVICSMLLFHQPENPGGKQATDDHGQPGQKPDLLLMRRQLGFSHSN
jgi:hypothetical protein